MQYAMAAAQTTSICQDFTILEIYLQIVSVMRPQDGARDNLMFFLLWAGFMRHRNNLQPIQKYTSVVYALSLRIKENVPLTNEV